MCGERRHQLLGARDTARVEVGHPPVLGDQARRIALERHLGRDARSRVQLVEVDREVLELAVQPRRQDLLAARADRPRIAQLRDRVGHAHSSNPRPFTVASMSGGGIEPSV